MADAKLTKSVRSYMAEIMAMRLKDLATTSPLFRRAKERYTALIEEFGKAAVRAEIDRFKERHHAIVAKKTERHLAAGDPSERSPDESIDGQAGPGGS